MGLGLSISYGIIQKHPGRIFVERTGPDGTTFVNELPIYSEGVEKSRACRPQSKNAQVWGPAALAGVAGG